MVGVYEVRLELGLGTPPSPLTQLTISQDIYTSNIVTIPVVDPTVQTPRAVALALHATVCIRLESAPAQRILGRAFIARRDVEERSHAFRSKDDSARCTCRARPDNRARHSVSSVSRRRASLRRLAI